MKQSIKPPKTHNLEKAIIEDAVVESSKSSISTQNKSNNTPIKPLYLGIGIFFVALIGILYYFKSSFVAAIVNGQPVWRWTLNEKLSKQYGQQTLDMIVTEKLIEQQAIKNKVVVSPEDINNEITVIEKQVSTEGQTLDQILLLQGMTRKDLEQQMKLNLLVQRLSNSQASPSAEEIAQYVKDNPDSLPKDVTGEKLDAYVSGLLVNQKKNQTIQTWLTNLKQGAKIQMY